MHDEVIPIGYLSRWRVFVALGLSSIAFAWVLNWLIRFLFHLEPYSRGLPIMFIALGFFEYFFLMMAVRAFTGRPALFIRGGAIIYLFAFYKSTPTDWIQSLDREAPGPWRARVWLTLHLLSGERMVVPTLWFRTSADEMIARLKAVGLPAVGAAADTLPAG